jgi:hypothetical protein
MNNTTFLAFICLWAATALGYISVRHVSCRGVVALLKAAIVSLLCAVGALLLLTAAIGR